MHHRPCIHCVYVVTFVCVMCANRELTQRKLDYDTSDWTEITVTLPSVTIPAPSLALSDNYVG
jgi:hypothetical protein